MAVIVGPPEIGSIVGRNRSGIVVPAPVTIATLPTRGQRGDQRLMPVARRGGNGWP